MQPPRDPSRPARSVIGALALLLAAALAAPGAGASSLAPEPRLVRVPLGGEVALHDLLEAGLDVVEVRPGREARLLEWPGDDVALARLGARVEVVDETPGHTAAARARAQLETLPPSAGKRVRSATGRDGVFRAQTLPPFGSGSMGGFWTLDEVKMKLDDLVASDANDLVENKLDTLGTSVLGRPIWGLKIGRHVSGPDTRPVAFFNALTHAREPGGMQALFYFVDDLLAGYGSDPFKTSLLDHRAIYIVPVVNPDGYQFNVNTYVGSGGTSFGFWRKNGRDNDGNGTHNSSNDGVDLNRNYGYQWGYNNAGSSASLTSEIYRGPSAFSEPETRAQRDIVEQLRPRTAISFHTYSDLFLHPWGWTLAATPDSARFYEWDDECTLGNGYHSGGSPHVLYEVNGEFNDWCYGDTLLKPRLFSWTPEAGNSDDGFWPPPSRITPIARENLRECYTAAAIAGSYVRAEGWSLAEGVLAAGNLARVAVRARNLGRAATGSGLEAMLVSLDPGAVVLAPGPIPYPTLASRQSGDATGGATFQVYARDTVTAGRIVRLRVEFADANGEYSRDTLEVPVGAPTLLVADGASAGLGRWVAGGDWGIVSDDPTHPSRYFADSPDTLYAVNSDAPLALAARLDLSAAKHAYATFETRWEFETDYDCAVVEASLDSVTWVPLGGHATVPGVFAPQPAGKPVFEGARHLWKGERVDLSPLAGPGATAVRFRFRSLSDGSVVFDGFDFDSLRIELYDLGAQPAPVAVGTGAPPAALDLAPPAPDPVRGSARLAFALPAAGNVRLEILDLSLRQLRFGHGGAG